jgi:hypothetical protein
MVDGFHREFKSEILKAEITALDILQRARDDTSEGNHFSIFADILCVI